MFLFKHCCTSVWEYSYMTSDNFDILCDGGVNSFLVSVSVCFLNELFLAKLADEVSLARVYLGVLLQFHFGEESLAAVCSFTRKSPLFLVNLSYVTIQALLIFQFFSTNVAGSLLHIRVYRVVPLDQC